MCLLMSGEAELLAVYKIPGNVSDLPDMFSFSPLEK